MNIIVHSSLVCPDKKCIASMFSGRFHEAFNGSPEKQSKPFRKITKSWILTFNQPFKFFKCDSMTHADHIGLHIRCLFQILMFSVTSRFNIINVSHAEHVYWQLHKKNVLSVLNGAMHFGLKWIGWQVIVCSLTIINTHSRSTGELMTSRTLVLNVKLESKKKRLNLRLFGHILLHRNKREWLFSW